MGKRLKRLVSLCLAMVVVLNTMIVAYAQSNNERAVEKSNSETTVFEDETGRYTITLEETMLSRTTKLYDESGNLIQTLILNKETGILLNPATGATIEMKSQKVSAPRMCKAVRAHDHEYEFCDAGEKYDSVETATVEELCEVAGMALTPAAIVAAIYVYGGVEVLKGAAKTAATSCAKKVISEYKGGRIDNEIEMKFNFTCKEQWESDSSYSGGGFWFLGYLPTGFKWKLIKNS